MTTLYDDRGDSIMASGSILDIKSAIDTLQTAVGDLKFKVLVIPNDKTIATLKKAHGVNQEIKFCARYPTTNVHSLGLMTECTITFDESYVYITKPNASFGGPTLMFYVFLVYGPA